ncbi:MAG: protease modulator HflC [Spirochaetaceae bacterium]|jgi:membrane protease subunit HflC|nr:protease modulator HflC [Spirochaetaceae bacterium]
MKKRVLIIIACAALVAAAVAAGPVYTLNEGEQAVIVQMGRIVDVVTEAGLHFKTPFVDTVTRYPKRIMAWDGEQKSMPTREKQYIWVDVTARWRVSDAKLFYESISSLSKAYSKLGEIIDSEVRTVVAENYLRESVRNTNMILAAAREGEAAREEEGGEAEALGGIAGEGAQAQAAEPIQKGRRRLAGLILERSRRMTGEYGIELIDVVTRQIRYSDELTQSVYARMIKERSQIAQAFRSEGEGKKAEWLGKTDNEQRSILSAAYTQAEKIRGEADAEASRVYAEAYGRDRSFFEFYRALESYKATLSRFDKTLTTDMDYFRFLYSPSGR